MVEQAWHYGCLFCRTGTECAIVAYINQSIEAVKAIVPMRTRRKTVAEKVIEDKVPLLPGYVFFRLLDAEQLPLLTRISNVLKILEYDTLRWELSGRDKEFATFLFDNDSIQPPQVTFIDGKLHFMDGFLYGHDDAVLRVNRRKQTVEIKLGIDRMAFWIGYRAAPAQQHVN